MSINIGERKIAAVILDLEKTLYPAEDADRIFSPARKQLAVALLSQPGITTEIPESSVRKKVDEYATLSDQFGWSQAYLKLGGKIDVFHQVVRGIDRSNGLKLNPELHQMLDNLRVKVKLGLLTKATVPTAEAICTKILGDRWRDLFDAIVCDGAPGCPAEKPDPRAFEFTLGQLRVTAERTVMVGDSLPDDILPAAALGMLTIFVGDQEGIGDLRISCIEELAILIETA